MRIDEPENLFKSSLQLGLHCVCVEVDVAIHALDIHLVRRTGKPVVLCVVATEVLNERLFQELQNSLIVLGVYRDLETVHTAVSTFNRADLDSSVGRQVTPELPEVLSIVVLEHENCVPHVFLHVIHKVRLEQVDRVLQRTAAANQGNLFRVVLDRDKRKVFPVQRLFIAPGVFRLNIGLLLGVLCQPAVLKGVSRNAVHSEKVDLLDDLLLGSVVHLNRIEPQSRIKLSVRGVCPEREHLIAGEHAESKLAAFVIVGVEPGDTCVKALDPCGFQGTHELHAENLLDLSYVPVIIAEKGDWLTEQVVGLLVYVFRVLVIHDTVVR